MAARISARAATNTLRAVRRAQAVRLALACPVTCRATVEVFAAGGGTVLARRAGQALRRGGQTPVTATLTAAGRRRIAARGAPRRLTAVITVRTTSGSSITVTRSVPLPPV